MHTAPGFSMVIRQLVIQSNGSFYHFGKNFTKIFNKNFNILLALRKILNAKISKSPSPVLETTDLTL